MSKCYAPGCDWEVPTERLMCGPHWRRVPAPLRDAVSATWRARLKALHTPDYADAVRAHEAAKSDAAAALRDRPPFPRGV